MNSRHKDANWLFAGTSLDEVQCALLMDLRDELKRLNALLYCPNFTGIPETLRQISRNTKKPKRKKNA